MVEYICQYSILSLVSVDSGSRRLKKNAYSVSNVMVVPIRKVTSAFVIGCATSLSQGGVENAGNVNENETPRCVN